MSEQPGFSPDDRVRLRREKVLWREVNGEIIGLSLQQSQYLTVNAPATELWQLLVEGATMHELAEALANRWHIDLVQAETDVAAFVAELWRSGVLETLDSAL